MLARAQEIPAADRRVQARLGDDDKAEERIAELRAEVDTVRTGLRKRARPPPAAACRASLPRIIQMTTLCIMYYTYYYCIMY